MISYKVNITEKAIVDLYDISSYISKELLEPSTAEKLLERFEEAIASLSQMPNRNPLIKDEELAHKGIRRIFVDNYTVFYVINDNEFVVTVIRVMYNKRDWINLI